MITRQDLAPGYQGVQSMHAAIQFGFEYPEVSREWFHSSNYLGFLSVANEEELNRLIERARMCDIKFSIFREPDIGDRITAIALEPGTKSKKLCSNIQCALRGSK